MDDRVNIDRSINMTTDLLWMTAADAAAFLGVSRATVLRQWRFAKAWLARKLGGAR